MKYHNRSVFFLILISLVFLKGPGLTEEGFSPAFSPPESKIVDSRDMTMAGIDIHSFLYSTSLTREAVIDYYQDYLVKQGFRLIVDTQDKNRRLLRFQKDKFMLNIALLLPSEETRVAVTYYIQPKNKPSPEKGAFSWEELISNALPSAGSADYPGKDLDFIPRPPESTRIFSVHMSNFSYLGYISTYSVDELRNFYGNNMIGWEAEDGIPMGDTVKKYKEVFHKKEVISSIPGIDLEQIVQGGYVMKYKGHDGAAQVNLFSNRYSEKNKAKSIILIRYDKK